MPVRHLGVAALVIGAAALLTLLPMPGSAATDPAARTVSSETEDRSLVFGPAFAGGGVVWNDSSGDPGPLALRRQTPQGPSLVSAEAHLLAASAGALVFLEQRKLRVGPPGGPFVPLRLRRGCRSERGVSVDARGSLVAFPDCPDAGARPVVYDVRTGRRTVLGFGVVGRSCCTEVQVAGRFVAWADWPGTGDVTVYDRQQKRVRYRARVSSWSFDLQEDGKIAAVVRGRPRSVFETIVWFSPAEPRSHPLRFIRSRGYDFDRNIRLADDRVAAVAAQGTNGYRGELVVLGLDGSRRPIARFQSTHERHQLDGGFDFDGERIVWGSKTVVDRRIVCDDWGCATATSGTWRIRLQHLRSPSKPRTVVSVSFRSGPRSS